MPSSFAEQRLNMIESQIKPFSVVNQRVLAAFEDVPRELFVPETKQSLAYMGEDFPMGEGRFLIEPSAYARLIQEADIQNSEAVLDVGCLNGYTSCILSCLAKSVTAIDTKNWVAAAGEKAEEAGFDAIIFTDADENCRNKELEKFDVIVINGAVQFVPETFTQQLKEGGRIATFIRNDRGDGHAVLLHKKNKTLHQKILFDAFIPLFPGFEKAEEFVF